MKGFAKLLLVALFALNVLETLSATLRLDNSMRHRTIGRSLKVQEINARLEQALRQTSEAVSRLKNLEKQCKEASLQLEKLRKVREESFK